MNLCEGTVGSWACGLEVSAPPLISLPGLLQCLSEGFSATEGSQGFPPERRGEPPKLGASRQRKHQPWHENPELHDVD
jgi:hypothetical protein